MQENVRYPNNTEVFISQSHAYKNSNSHSRKQVHFIHGFTRRPKTKKKKKKKKKEKKKKRVNFLGGCLQETCLSGALAVTCFHSHGIIIFHCLQLSPQVYWLPSTLLGYSPGNPHSLLFHGTSKKILFCVLRKKFGDENQLKSVRYKAVL